MKRLMLLCLGTAFLVPTIAFANCNVPVLPNSFTVKEKFFAFGSVFDVASGSQGLGEVERKIFSWTPHFRWFDERGNLIASARQRAFSWGVKIDVSDCQGNIIGGVQEKVFESLFKVRTEYAVVDAQGREIAKSVKIEFGDTTFTISSGSQIVAELKRPWFNFFVDHWDVEVYDHRIVDSRLLVMLGVFKTNADNERARNRDYYDDDYGYDD